MCKSKVNVHQTAYKICDVCGDYDVRFCANCQTEVESNNRCPQCNKFVKVTVCPECYGQPEEINVGDNLTFFISKHSIEEHKTLFNFKGSKGKSYNAKVIEIIGHTEVKIRIRGKEIIVSTEDLYM